MARAGSASIRRALVTVSTAPTSSAPMASSNWRKKRVQRKKRAQTRQRKTPGRNNETRVGGGSWVSGRHVVGHTVPKNRNLKTARLLTQDPPPTTGWVLIIPETPGNFF